MIPEAQQPQTTGRERCNWYWLSRYRGALYGLFMVWIFLFHVQDGLEGMKVSRYALQHVVTSGNFGVDAFLFLSGISLYFAMQKRGGCVRRFYAGRFTRILVVYRIFSLPYFALLNLTGLETAAETWQQITFTRPGGSAMWFLGCIALCYALYPALYRLIVRGQKALCLLLTALYIILLAIWNTLNPEGFAVLEIMFCRFPVFVLGALAGPLVYEKKPVRPALLVVLLLPLFARDLIETPLRLYPALDVYRDLIHRLFGSLQAVGVVFLLVLLLRYLEGGRLYRWLSAFGGITLEFYVVHIAVRKVLRAFLGWQPHRWLGVLAFIFVYFVLSLLGALLLHRLLNWLLRPRGNKAARQPQG